MRRKARQGASHQSEEAAGKWGFFRLHRMLLNNWMQPEGGWMLVSGLLILADRPGLSLGLYQNILYYLISNIKLQGDICTTFICFPSYLILVYFWCWRLNLGSECAKVIPPPLFFSVGACQCLLFSAWMIGPVSSQFTQELIVPSMTRWHSPAWIIPCPQPYLNILILSNSHMNTSLSLIFSLLCFIC